ncbi:excalibur calcium-binding domain-containing protein [Streptomyces sp. YS-3]|uniref:excalibur calcium-binding domain-containing protein n=1 Tax=Streptomyces sp. YS-3 TaxID=3381352 RepID=UPI00386243D3
MLAFASCALSSGTAHAQTDLDCSDFRSQEEAQAVFDRDRSDPFRLDEDHDGIACETLPRRGTVLPTPAPFGPTAIPTRGAQGGLGGTSEAGPGRLEIGAGVVLVTGAAGIGYIVLRRRRQV